MSDSRPASSPSVFVCADIEGVSGYVDPREDEEDRAAVRRAMTDDVNAVVKGVREAAPAADVVVADAHGSKRNVVPGDLDPAAELVRGGPRPLGMVQGGEADHDLAAFVGFHDRPGSGGHVEHVFSGSISEVRLDDEPVGEFELNARLLGALGVPVGLVSGDDVLEATVADALPDAEYVRTKRAVGARAAACRHPKTVRADLRDAAKRATEGRESLTAPVPETPVTVAVTYDRPTHAEVAALWPGVERGADSRTVTHTAEAFREAYRFARAASKVSA